ncbi:hypothetical protein [Pseudoxanthomonas sp. UTMC 1351]|uniref:hypothetical protein n=1 Tax=Pseudoxanthomonas sp. UTMC 1351 TaxID=2695853 RepID=UPI0034CEF82C
MAITASGTFNTINGAAVYTPPDAATPLLYVFVTQFGYATGVYSDYVSEDDLVAYNATEDTTFEYPLSSILYTTFNGSTWSECEQVPNAVWELEFSDPLPSVAVFPAASFGDNLSPVTDIYLSTVQSAQPYGGPQLPGGQICAAFVGGLNQYSAGSAPSQVTSFPAYSTNPFQPTGFAGVSTASLLAVNMPGFAAPQPWLFYSTFYSDTRAFQMQYAVHTASGWISYPLPPIVVHVSAPPQKIGSPAAIPIPTGASYQTWQSLTVFNSTCGMQGYASYFAPGGELVTPISVIPEATGSPSLALLNNQTYLFYQGAGSQTGQLWYTQCDTMAYGGVECPGGRYGRSHVRIAVGGRARRQPVRVLSGGER